MIKTPLHSNGTAQERGISKIGIINTPTLRSMQSKKIERFVRPRTDVRTRAVVDKSIEMESILGPVIAAGFLRQQHVPFNVAERVLLHPEQRRKA